MQFVTRFYPPRVSDTTCAYYAQMRATRTRAHFSSLASACLCKAKVLCRSACARDCFRVLCVVRIRYTVENAFSACILPSPLHQPDVGIVSLHSSGIDSVVCRFTDCTHLCIHVANPSCVFHNFYILCFFFCLCESIL